MGVGGGGVRAVDRVTGGALDPVSRTQREPIGTRNDPPDGVVEWAAGIVTPVARERDGCIHARGARGRTPIYRERESCEQERDLADTPSAAGTDRVRQTHRSVGPTRSARPRSHLRQRWYTSCP